MNKKKILIGLIVILVVSILVCLVVITYRKRESIIESDYEIAEIPEENIIFENEILDKPMEEGIEEIETQETNTLNYMTNLEALYKAAVDSGIKVTDDEVDENYSKTMSSIESTFNLTEDEFLNKFNLTKDYVKTSLKKELIATTYLQDNSEVSEDEAKNYYNNNKEDFFQIRASHILITKYDEDGKELSDEKKAENKKLAEKILKRVKNGESFDDLALEYSDDSYTASKGGDLGYFW